MGLKEQLSAGATALLRQTIATVVTGSLPRYTGSISLGRTFVLTNVQSTEPCRLRLYSNAASRDNVGELARPYNSQSVSGSTALIADINLTDSTLFHFAPPLFGANLDNPIQTSVYYTIDTGSVPFSGSNTISLTRFVLEDGNIVSSPGVVTRENLIINQTVSTGQTITGSFVTPKTYLLLQAVPNISPIRLRLYANSTYRDDLGEFNRAFGVEPSASSGIITDMNLDITETSSFTPVLLGRNMDASPASTTYYTLTNNAGASSVTVSLIVFSLED